MLIGFLLHVLVELDPPRFNDGALRETEDILLALGFYIERLKYRRRCGCSYACLDERSAFHFFGVGGFLFCLLAYLAFVQQTAERGRKARRIRSQPRMDANAREWTGEENRGARMRADMA